MKEKSELNLPKELAYTAEHIWVKPDGDNLLIGITDYAQDQLGEIVFIDLPEPDTHYDAGQEFGSVESVKSVNSLFMPVTGTVIKVNETLADQPEIANGSCYSDAWIIAIEPDDKEAVKSLLDSAKYAASLPD